MDPLESAGVIPRYFPLLLLPLIFLVPPQVPASSSALAFTGGYSESFDGLPATGSLTLTDTGAAGAQGGIPGLSGWQGARVGGTATTALTVAATPSNTGRLYAYGTGGSSDRALGLLASGSTITAVGIALQNASSRTFQRITLQFVREIWHTQGTSTANPFEDRIRFFWGIDTVGVTPANFLTYPTLTPHPVSDAISPAANTVIGVSSGSTPDRVRSGQSAPWSGPVSATLTGLQWAPGQTLFLRWQDADDAGFDAGIALDDLSIEATSGPFPVSVALPSASAGQLQLSWPSLPGNSYRLQDSTRLDAWSDLAGFPRVADGFVLAHEAPLGPGSRFFRVWENEVSPAGQEVLFTAPGPAGTEEDFTFEQKLKALLAQAPAGSSVRAAIYTWTRETMSEAFIEAWQRGVDVKLIVGSDFPAVDLLLAAMRDRVSICRDAQGIANGCMGGRINHNKFVLFSSLTDGSTHVTVQSSANFTGVQLPNANNLVIIRRDPALHAAYLQYWQDLAARPLNPDYYRMADGSAGTRVWFFPRAGANGSTGEKDPIVEQLDAVNPAAGGSIRITMAFWTSPRRAIAHRLAALRQAGMDVAVVTHPQETSAEILQILRNGGVTVHQLAPIHSKYLLMDAVQEGIRRRWVFTGSHNYTGPALTENDETLLRLAHPRLYENFLADWQRLAAHPLAR